MNFVLRLLLFTTLCVRKLRFRISQLISFLEIIFSFVYWDAGTGYTESVLALQRQPSFHCVLLEHKEQNKLNF